MITALLARWGLGWLLGPMGKAVGIAMAGILVIHFIRADAIADCQAKQFEVQLIQAGLDQRIAEDIADSARARARESEIKIRELEGITNEIILNNTNGCAISDELREQLRAIQ